MTIQNLIDILNSIPDKNTRIVHSGYEGGFHDIEGVKETKLILNVYSAYYYGPHEEGYPIDNKPLTPAYKFMVIPNKID